MRPLYVLMMAHLVSVFNWLENSFGTDHVLVQKILGMWKVLNICDDCVPQVENVDRRHEILRNWSKVVQDDFENQMSCRLLHNSTGPDKIIDVLCGEVMKLVETNRKIR